MKLRLLLLFPLDAPYREPIAEVFDVVDGIGDDQRAQAIGGHSGHIDAVLTTGSRGLTAAEIDSLPGLRFVGCYGAGFEGIDVAHLHRRGIPIFNGRGANDDCVADHALALLLSAVRGIGKMDRASRNGLFRDDLPLEDQLSGKRVGLLGLGQIGRKIARRLAAFDVTVGYHARHAVPDVPYAYEKRLVDLAGWSDHLVVAAPGGASTQHLVDGSILEALGPRGWLVNVGRGSIVDTPALALALEAGKIAGAALDVYEGEPRLPEALLGVANLIVTPHVAGSSPQAMQATTRLFLANAQCWLSGRPLLTPIDL